MSCYKNYLNIDLRILSQCIPKIDRFRVSGLLMALYNSVMSDLMETNLMEEHDKMFTPKNKYEQIFWESCRELAKRDIMTIHKRAEGGKMGGRPPKEKNVQALLEETAENLSVDKAKDKILITDSFSVSKYPALKIYIDEMQPEVIKSVEKWLKEKKKGEKVSLEFITQQFINFAKRQNKPLFKKNT